MRGTNQSQPEGVDFSLYFDPTGRINRQTYWIKGILIGLLCVLGIGATGIFLIVQGEPIAWLGIVVWLATLLCIYWCSFVLAVKRLHDRDKSAWWILISFIPIAGPIWLFIEVGCLAGTPGPNRYGDDPNANTAIHLQ